MSLCKDCITGFTHEGTPTGKWEEIAGIKSYVATPEGDYPKDKVILYLPDVFGVGLVNAQLLADDFARHGFQTIIPDYLNDDPIPTEALLFGPEANFDIMGWLGRHSAEKTRPILDAVIAALKERGVKRFGATGYCFGGRYTFDLAFDDAIQVAVTSHPSLLKVPDDLEKYLSTAKAPLLINGCTVDQQFPPESQEVAKKILGDGKFAPGFKLAYFEECTHGFAVRGDLSDPKVKAGKEGAFTEATLWFHSYL